jgi:hypothetical protein
MSTKKPHDATVMVKLGDSDWTPSCHADMERARAKSARAGQRKAKGVPATDILPIHVRPLSDIEKASKLRCLISTLGV